MRVYQPIPGTKPIVQFGLNRNILTDEPVNSKGLVYASKIGALAAQDGIAIEVGHNAEFDHYVVLKHAPDLYTFYAHGEHEPKNFKQGDLVEVGEHVFDANSFYFEVRRSPDGDQVDPGIFFHPMAQQPGVTDPDQASLKVDGILGEATWKAWQSALKANRTWFYPGLVDGIPGEKTWAAIKTSVGMFFNESEIDEDKAMAMGVQLKLQEREFYRGPLNGLWDEETVSALQRCLNAAKYK